MLYFDCSLIICNMTIVYTFCAIVILPQAALHRLMLLMWSNAPDDGQNCCPKHVELILIYQ